MDNLNVVIANLVVTAVLNEAAQLRLQAEGNLPAENEVQHCQMSLDGKHEFSVVYGVEDCIHCGNR